MKVNMRMKRQEDGDTDYIAAVRGANACEAVAMAAAPSTPSSALRLCVRNRAG